MTEKKEGTPGTVTPKLKFWIDLAKWFIVSVALVVTTKIIDTGLKNRAADLAEMKFYDQFVTELIVLNPSPVNKIMLAEYILCVAPSEKIRERWKVYYDSIYPEYLDYITPILLENETLTEKYQTLKQAVNITPRQAEEMNRIKQQIDKNNKLLRPSFTIPAQSKLTRMKEE